MAPALRTLCLVRLVNGFGDGITLIALTLLAAPRGPYAVSALLLAATLPRLAGPLLGALGDRRDARTVLSATVLLQGACILSVALFEPPLPAVITLVAMSAAGATIFGPTVRRVVPDVVPAQRLAQANAWLSSAGNTAMLAGSALGGLLAVTVGARGALLVDVATFAVAAVLIHGLPHLPARAATATLLADTRAGLAHVRSEPAVRSLALGTFALVAFLGLDNVALVFLVTDELGASPTAYGVVQAAYGAAMLLASLCVLRWPAITAGRWLVAGGVLGAAGAVATGLAPNPLVAGFAQSVAGAGNALDVIASDTLVQQLVPRDMLSRVGATVGTAAQLGMAVAAGAGGPLLAAAGPRAVLIIAGIGSLTALLLYLPAVRRA